MTRLRAGLQWNNGSIELDILQIMQVPPRSGQLPTCDLLLGYPFRRAVKINPPNGQDCGYLVHFVCKENICAAIYQFVGHSNGLAGWMEEVCGYIYPSGPKS